MASKAKSWGPVAAVQAQEVSSRPRGRPSYASLVRYRSFQYQAASWDRPRRTIAKVEHHLGELLPRVGFIVTTLAGTNRLVVRFYNQRGTAEQWWPPITLAICCPGCSGWRRAGPGPEEPPATALQDGRAAHPTCLVLHPATRWKLLDGEPLSADSPAHQAARVAPDV